MKVTPSAPLVCTSTAFVVFIFKVFSEKEAIIVYYILSALCRDHAEALPVASWT